MRMSNKNLLSIYCRTNQHVADVMLKISQISKSQEDSAQRVLSFILSKIIFNRSKLLYVIQNIYRSNQTSKTLLQSTMC